MPSQGDLSLRALLEALLKTGVSAPTKDGDTNKAWVEVLVAWDAKTSASRRLEFEQTWTQVRFVQAQVAGVNAARNSGIENARFERIWLLDDDVLPVQTPLLDFWRSDFDDRKVWGGEYLSLPQASRAMRSANCLARMWRKSASHPRQEALLGGSLSFSRNLWREVGRFSEAWEYGGTETEWLFRVWRAGFESVHHSHLDVWHVGRARSWPQHLRAFWRQGLGKARTHQALPSFGKRLAQAAAVRPNADREDLRDQVGALVLWSAALAGTLYGRVENFVGQRHRPAGRRA